MTENRDARILELCVAAQVSIFVVGVSWAFGGNADWVRVPVSAWGTLGILMAPLALWARARVTGRLPKAVGWLWPVLALNAVVLLSGLTPAYRILMFGGEPLQVPVRVPWWTPSSAAYGSSLRALWLFDGIYFSCINLAVVVESRRVLRVLGAVVAGNAVLLAVFGIAQKILGSPGLYFGAVKSPNLAFFASFVYDNHWGAFAVLMAGTLVGLTLRYAHGISGWGFLHGPSLAGAVGAALLMVAVPLSGSRAGTLMVGVLAAVAVAHGFSRIRSGLSASGVPPAVAVVVIVLSLGAASLGIWEVVGDTVKARAEVTRRQVLSLLVSGEGASRKAAYRDTWSMAREKPLFGWGMGSFPSVFPIYNRQVRPTERLPIVYHDAHSDWLQSLAELGFAGTLLIVAAVVLPGRELLKGRLSDYALFLMAGCALVAAYAAVEFPFGNVAVVLSWWFCFVAAVQYTRLSRRGDAGGREG
jgi:O-antigen ligase